MTDDIIRVLGDPVKALQRASDLIVSTGNSGEYPQSRQRNDDLSVLAAALHYRLLLDPTMLYKTDKFASLAKEIIVCAYLLGRRDSQDVPGVFNDAD